MIEDYGLFIGLSVMPTYSNRSINTNMMIDEILEDMFLNYREKLKNSLSPKELNPELYKPLHYLTFGNFNVLSLCQIDDFYFGNFSFRPYSKYIREKNRSESNYQYQVTNGVNNIVSKSDSILSEFDAKLFVGICKIKIHPYFLLRDGYDVLARIKTILLDELKKREDIISIISESFSWHELTILIFSNSVSKILNSIIDIRKFDESKFSSTELSKNQNLKHLFVDTHTTIGFKRELLDKQSIEFINYERINEDDEINISSKLQIKTGHGRNLRKIFENLFSEEIDSKLIKFIDGRSDHVLQFNKKAIHSFLSCWGKLMNLYDNENSPWNHIRKIHTNVSTLITDVENNSHYKFDTKYHTELFQKLKFTEPEISKIELDLQKLNVAKDVSNIVLSAFSNFNDIICDVTLYQYFISTKPLLINLKELLNSLANNDNTIINFKKEYELRAVYKLTELILKYINTWQVAFQNRFQESKRYGYNTDSKVEFNGGVHQIIQTYDSLYKLIISTYKISASVLDKYLVPIATYGSQQIGIRSTIQNLHLNYYQLFQPEYFLFGLTKEALNKQLSRYWFDDEHVKGIIQDINQLSKEISQLIHEVSDIEFKKLLFQFCEPKELKDRINYIATYAVWYDNMFDDNLDLFTFWFWHTYLQTSENYNIDGSLRISVFRKTLFAIECANKCLKIEKTTSDFINSIKSTDFQFIATQINKETGNNILKECSDCIKFFENNNFIFYKINNIVDKLINLSLKIDREEANYKEFKKITISYLTEFRKDILTNGNQSVYLREPESGKGFNYSNYTNAIIDPHGGTFVVNSNVRHGYFKRKINLFTELRELGMRYKQKLYTELKD